MKLKKYIPNIISISRLYLSLSMLLFLNYNIVLIIIYLLCGITDILDGYLARKLKCESSLGSKLDSLSDFVFFSVVIYYLLYHSPITDYNYVLVYIIIVTILRVINFIITKIKFNTFSMMHTILNKVTGVTLFIFIPLCITIPVYIDIVSLILLIIGSLSSIEELMIITKINNYNVNYKSIFSINKS